MAITNLELLGYLAQCFLNLASSISQSINTSTGKNLLIKNNILNTIIDPANFYSSIEICSSVTCSMKCLHLILYTAPSIHIILMGNMAREIKA